MNESIAIVGRTNVGKSLLFNKLTKARKSLVADYHGVTRDINTGYMQYKNKNIYIEDTGGIPGSFDDFSKLIINKASNSISKASLIVFVVSASDGLTNQDYDICKMLRKLNRQIILVINKCDLTKKSQPISEFYKLGIKEVFIISAKNNIGLDELRNRLIIIKSSKFIEQKNIFRRISRGKNYYRLEIKLLMTNLLIHRGIVSKNYKENLLKSFKQSFKKGYGIETDIHATKDDKFICFHDFTLNRIFKKNISVKNLNYSKIKEISSKNNKTIPLLKDLLKTSKNKYLLFIELKPTFSKKLLQKLLKETWY